MSGTVALIAALAYHLTVAFLHLLTGLVTLRHGFAAATRSRLAPSGAADR